MARNTARHGASKIKSSAVLGGTVVAIGVAVVALLLSAQSPPAATREPRSEGTPSSQAGVVATQTPSPATEPTPSASQTAPLVALAFDADSAVRFIEDMESFGPRRAGGKPEKRCAEYLASQLTTMGYEPMITEFELPNGRTSRNVVAQLKGRSDSVIILGAHMDSKPPAPGANDNLSGCGVVLEVARAVASSPITPTVEFVFFGAEEMVDSNPDHHHYGSRAYVESMNRADRQSTVGMISVDMVGHGKSFAVRTMNKGPQALRRMLVKSAKGMGLPAEYLRDPGSSGWSDHEPFELAGMPSAWLEWREDTTYHTARDVSSHLQRKRIKQTGRFMMQFLQQLDDVRLEKLLAASESDR